MGRVLSMHGNVAGTGRGHGKSASKIAASAWRCGWVHPTRRCNLVRRRLVLAAAGGRRCVAANARCATVQAAHSFFTSRGPTCSAFRSTQGLPTS